MTVQTTLSLLEQEAKLLKKNCLICSFPIAKLDYRRNEKKRALVTDILYTGLQMVHIIDAELM